MKRIALALSCWVLAVGAFAQNAAVNKADRFRQSGDLVQAKENIDEAIVHEKTLDKGRTWFVYGQVYEDIFNSEDPAVQGLAENPLAEAIKGYNKAQELDREGSNYHTLAGFNLDNLWGGLLNRGATAFQEEDNAEAIKWFDKAKMIKPEDTTAYLYAGIAAQGIEEYDAVLENFKSLIELGYENLDVYNSVIYYTRAHSMDTVGALDWTQKAREVFPDDDNLRKQEVNLLIQTGRIEDAKNGLEEAIAKEPDNANLLFNLGYLYEELGDEENAIANYEKAIEADPNYFDAVYNVGVLYYNRAADLYKEANDLPIREYDRRGKALEDEAKENLRLSMPYLEKSAEIRPEEAIIWNTLSTIYTRLGMSDKAQNAFAKYEELSGN